ncbi:MAG: hypothetical protein RMX96_20750 [Nostoc sp. ChiSLP02]|nr:hypothetical protein [Nostoc sp. DedSLP05]MDZ8102257.1 hypothetical protein [Nostoc sp. DedSLP01]MDZ8187262.1 hypothetical protein [Nostoc sp. ChiSLP02]
MSEHKKSDGQIEINNLIENAIADAVTRRELVETLSDEESAGVAGGVGINKIVCKPPIIIGIIAQQDDRQAIS